MESEHTELQDKSLVELFLYIMQHPGLDPLSPQIRTLPLSVQLQVLSVMEDVAHKEYAKWLGVCLDLEPLWDTLHDSEDWSSLLAVLPHTPSSTLRSKVVAKLCHSPRTLWRKQYPNLSRVFKKAKDFHKIAMVLSPEDKSHLFITLKSSGILQSLSLTRLDCDLIAGTLEEGDRQKYQKWILQQNALQQRWWKRAYQQDLSKNAQARAEAAPSLGLPSKNGTILQREAPKRTQPHSPEQTQNPAALHAQSSPRKLLKALNGYTAQYWVIEEMKKMWKENPQLSHKQWQSLLQNKCQQCRNLLEGELLKARRQEASTSVRDRKSSQSVALSQSEEGPRIFQEGLSKGLTLLYRDPPPFKLLSLTQALDNIPLWRQLQGISIQNRSGSALSHLQGALPALTLFCKIHSIPVPHRERTQSELQGYQIAVAKHLSVLCQEHDRTFHPMGPHRLEVYEHQILQSFNKALLVESSVKLADRFYTRARAPGGSLVHGKACEPRLSEDFRDRKKAPLRPRPSTDLEP